jgi:AraC-like DNA-binding protein
MVLHIKNMVCNRCNWVVKTELEKLGFTVQQVTLGEVTIAEAPAESALSEITKRLESFGFEMISDKSVLLIEQIKKLIIALVNDPELREKWNMSDYLARSLHRDYSQMSKLFSEYESITVEQFYILQKIEKAKEWLAYDELSLTQIAFNLGYSSVAHLSAQFRKITGLTPSHFKNLRGPKRNPIDEVIPH